MSIAVICPSRGNPAALKGAATSFLTTKVDGSSTFVAVLDENDPLVGEYVTVTGDLPCDVLIVPTESTGNMNLALNYAAERLWHSFDIIGFVGDDHRFRTKSWDSVVTKVLAQEGGGFVYANDLYMGQNLPTQVFISSAIVRGLGWFGLPGARHLYLDNTWKMLGDAADCLYYLPDVVIEHMHPAAGKAAWDENHVRVNDPEWYRHDAAIYETWLHEGMERDIETVRRALGK